MQETEKQADLRKHKAIATGFFVLMAIIYSLMVYFQHHNLKAWMGYVEAFAEAGMVGALADWFAVTALFKHPLGLKITHTNLIERKKNALGQSLGEFVNENFLNPDNIRPYIERLNISKILSDWFDKPKNQKVLLFETKSLLQKIIEDIDDDEVHDFLKQNGTDLLQGVDYKELASSGVQYMVKNNEHIKLLERLLPQIKTYIQENDQLILDRIGRSRPLIALLAGKKISHEITDGLVKFIEEIEINKYHFVREKLTQNLNEFASEVKTEAKWDEKFNNIKEELIVSENLEPYAEDAWRAIKEILRKNLEEPDSNLENYLRKTINKVSTTLKNDKVLQGRLNNWIRHFLYRMILKNRKEVEQLISKTVAGWEGKELSRKLELEVGKDLQFIRINGTLVGGLVGLVIYIITRLFI